MDRTCVERPHKPRPRCRLRRGIAGKNNEHIQIVGDSPTQRRRPDSQRHKNLVASWQHALSLETRADRSRLQLCHGSSRRRPNGIGPCVFRTVTLAGVQVRSLTVAVRIRRLRLTQQALQSGRAGTARRVGGFVWRGHSSHYWWLSEPRSHLRNLRVSPRRWLRLTRARGGISG